ncbi:MAG: penicillin-binding transpeptidase domain-containing protein, partial [Candidatus Aadella gelida]|nr:penicillin-binding transpeptidase domain-containing protein [Candidatus Aadella gelida]
MRIKIFSIILVVCMLSLSVGLAYVQILRHEKYKVMSEENRLKIVPLMAPRGKITDRNGEPLVKDVLSFQISVIYNRVRDKNALASIVSNVLNLTEEEILSRLSNARKVPYEPSVIVRDVGIEEVIKIEELAGNYPGLLVEVSAKREYLKGKTAASVLGYLGYINRSEFDKLKHYGYRVNDRTGRDGVEKYYDDYLRGRNGGKQIEVDHRGREVDILGLREPVSGKDLQLTIDVRLQTFCGELMEGKKGAIIVMDPDTGEIITMTSVPTYDPNIFIEELSDGDVSRILNSKDYPLMNRAISGVYPPGSVFKIVPAMGALETGV